MLLPLFLLSQPLEVSRSVGFSRLEVEGVYSKLLLFIPLSLGCGLIKLLHIYLYVLVSNFTGSCIAEENVGSPFPDYV
jgi:hypothetical protein